ncbi:hypothetical protein ACH5RR_036621 [Cinchona calisaya]|uniref:Uncharacterized protein n=1 Tax=Cinchona calisaya TaxID=153742 RepID=A0ABD2Y8H5_9GENT
MAENLGKMESKKTPEEEQEVKMKTEEEMKPWEQHSAVISIPRFDYSAPSSLLNHSHSGFLITCPIKREKSATKEAMSILEKYIRSLSGLNAEGFESLDANMSAKRRRICEEELGNNIESKAAANDGQPGKPLENFCSPHTDSRTDTKRSDSEASNPLSLVKLTKSGLLLLIFPKEGDQAVVDIVMNIIQSRENGSLKSPQ